MLLNCHHVNVSSSVWACLIISSWNATEVCCTFFLFGYLVSFSLDHLCSFHESWQRWIEGEWNKVQRHTCCIRSPKSVKENIRKGPLTAKTTNTPKPHKYPLVPLFCLWKQKVLPEKNSISVVMESLMIYRLCRLLQTLMQEERKSQVKGWSLATEHLGVAPWLEQEPLTRSGGQGGNSWHRRMVNVCNSYISALRLLLQTESWSSLGRKEHVRERCVEPWWEEHDRHSKGQEGQQKTTGKSRPQT